MQPGKDLLIALARLKHNKDFQTFVDEYLNAELDEQIMVCIEAPDPTLAQGSAQTLKRIITLVDCAEEAFHKLTNNTEQIPL